MKTSIALSIFSGLILIGSFPNYNLWPCAWFGFVPVFFALNNKSRKKAFFLFFLTGIIFWSGIIYWLVHVTLAGTIVLILYLALYFAIFGLVIRACTRHSTPYALIFIPSVWVLLEYIRSHLFTGFPWALLGYSQYLNLPVIQMADITGAWGVSFLVMMVNVLIIEVIGNRLWVVGKNLRIISLLPILLLILSLGYGYYRLRLQPTTYNLQPIKVSVIQGNIPQELKWQPAAEAYILNKYQKMTEEAALLNPDLIVWPEASNPQLAGRDDGICEDILNLAKKIKIPLLIGSVTGDKEKYFNSALLIDGSGRLIGWYDKLHLVPFGEYIPLKKILPFLETVVPIGDIDRGKEYTIFRLPAPHSRLQAKFAVLICFEDLFPELSRQFAKDGAGLLVNITNDAWYKQTSAPYQHLQASVFRAVENRLFLARSANTGVSGFINPDGKIISLVEDKRGSSIFIDGFCTENIAITEKPLTFYTRHGDTFIFACLLFALYGIILLLKKKR